MLPVPALERRDNAAPQYSELRACLADNGGMIRAGICQHRNGETSFCAAAIQRNHNVAMRQDRPNL